MRFTATGIATVFGGVWFREPGLGETCIGGVAACGGALMWMSLRLKQPAAQPAA